MNANVWLRTLTLAIVCSIFGMWHATHSLPALPARVMRVRLDASPRAGRSASSGRGRSGTDRRAGLIRSALFAVPCTSWQLKQVTPRVYITLCTKSLPCIRFLCAVPSGKCVNVVSPELVLLELPEVLQVRRPGESRPASRSTARRSDSSAAGPASGTGCTCRWRGRSRAAPGLTMLAARRRCDVLAARAVAPLAADVPFGRPPWSARCS